MKSQQLVEIITDAVVAAVREALPRMVREQLDRRMAQVITPALDAMEHTVHGVQASVQERITSAQADFATRAIAQADALTSSWASQVEALQASIVDQVGKAVSAIPSLVGPQGPSGPPGRDATMVPPVHWKADTTFTRGSVVMHRGGLWFANQDTSAEPGSGVDGYTLMFDGGELTSYTHDAEGFELAVYTFASGRTRDIPTGHRPMNYVGVYDHETAYHLNDVVTCEGSMWVCRVRSATGLRPRTDEGARTWTLAVKCGRDGAPGARGERGAEGPAGPPAAAPARGAKPNKPNGVQS